MGAFRSDFYGNGSSLPKFWYRSIGSWSHYNFAARSFYTMKLCNRLSMVFVDIYAKTSNLGMWTLFLEVTCDARPWLMTRWKAHAIRLNWLFLAVYYGSGVMRLNVYSSAVFAGRSTSLHSNFTPTGNHCWQQKTRDTGLSDGKDRIPLRSLVLKQYPSATDRRADGRICRNIYSDCKASFWGAVKRHKQGIFDSQNASDVK